MGKVSAPAEDLPAASAPSADRTAMRQWFRDDIRWIMRELDTLKTRSELSEREKQNPIEGE